MRKGVNIALGVLAALAIGAGSAAVGYCFGYYKGVGVGWKTKEEVTGINEAHRALSEVNSSMAALGKSDPSLLQQQLALHMRASLARLGALSKTGAYLQCSDEDRGALAAAADYLAAHPDPALFGADPLVGKGMTFCESYHGVPGVTVTYVATGKS